MMQHSARRAMLGALAILAGAIPAAAQQQPPAALPATPGASTLAPHPPRLAVTPPERIDLSRIRVPRGFQVELWAHSMPGARMMARGARGTLYVGTRTVGRVYAVNDHGDRRESRVLLQGLTQPNGLAIRDGALYVAAINRMLRYDNIEDRADPPRPIDLTQAFNLPADQRHGWKFLAFGPDGRLYVPVGAPCNVCEVDPDVHANIRSYNPDGTGMEIVARGVRNSVGFDFHPRTGALWFTDNGRDWAGEDSPQDELNRVARAGADFGFPACHAEGVPDPDMRRPNPCEAVTRPVALLGPHTAALGMRFYTGGMFPAAYRERIFIARRGSWNRTQKAGYDVVTVTVGADGSNARVEPFMTGFLDEAANTFWGRPVDVLQLPDGSLLVSDEHNGAIYRVSYRA